MIIKTNIKNVRSDFKNVSSWTAELGIAEDYVELVMAEEAGSLVNIECEATDGYFDVKLPNGYVVEALSAHHLVGFNDEGTINFDELGA
jgi:hypothetical protein